MTRINLVDPKLLVRQHLIAEYRESPRIFWLVQNAIARGETVEQARNLSPSNYTLGTGHCRFFYTRLGWLSSRYLWLVREMNIRGYQTTFGRTPEWADSIDRAWWGSWEPTPVCVRLNVARINLRLDQMRMPEHKIVLESV